MLLATIRNYQPELDVILWHPAKMRLIDDGYKKLKRFRYNYVLRKSVFSTT